MTLYEILEKLNYEHDPDYPYVTQDDDGRIYKMTIMPTYDGDEWRSDSVNWKYEVVEDEYECVWHDVAEDQATTIVIATSLNK